MGGVECECQTICVELRVTGCCPLALTTPLPRDFRSAREMGRYVGRTGKMAAITDVEQLPESVPAVARRGPPDRT